MPEATGTNTAPRRPRRTSANSAKKMAGIAEGRLREERRSWRKDHPIGFVARPRSKADGSTDLLNWDVRPRRCTSRRRVASMASRGLPHAVAATPPHAGRDPGQKRHDVGGLRVQPHDGVQQRLPRHRTNRQVRVAAGPVPVSAFTRRRRRDASSTPSPRRLLEISHTQARSSGT